MSAETTPPPMLDIEAASRLARALVSPIAEAETVPLAQAPGRVAARRIAAPRALPAADRSAMDGFALRAADPGEGTLPVAGTVAAGDPRRTLPEGASLRIFTGALLPEGADAVVPVEDCLEEGGRLRLRHPVKAGDHVRRAGSEQPEGGTLLRAGARVRPQHVGLLAANGIDRLAVVRRPRLGILSTGDELGRDGQGPEGIPDSNRPMLIALAQAAGAEVEDLGILPDDRDATVARLRALCGRHDLLVTSGAVSMGGRDHLRPALEAAGGTVEGWRVALKPGKPVLFGRLGPTAVTALPGHPLAAFVTFHLFVAAQIAQMLHAPWTPLFTEPARAGFDGSRKPGRAEVVPVRMGHGQLQGVPILRRLSEGGSGSLYPLAEADGLALIPSDIDRIRSGDRLLWHRFACGRG
ncbi:gephyrin-like molybdotransferase Glp [Cereibacter johrii]|uniref:molybdopterin molybdotransferase MoeA n=1 Tax=Cereibacter johrii TaxID=445629 RepID=UPI002B25A101|nr:gephyrin-like molybdotransferase Glp [Cereibacter johrii]MEA5160253.1 gephyrin-like molybdotransferase Glp [Cereibacter johrii]